MTDFRTTCTEEPPASRRETAVSDVSRLALHRGAEPGRLKTEKTDKNHTISSSEMEAAQLGVKLPVFLQTEPYAGAPAILYHHKL